MGTENTDWMGSSAQAYEAADLFALMNSEEYQSDTGFFRIPIGISDGVPVIENLSAISNLLITGMPMSGKTAFVQSLLMALMLSHEPEDFCWYCFSSKPFEYRDGPYTLSGGSRYSSDDDFYVEIFRKIKTVRENSPKTEIVIVVDDMYSFVQKYGVKALTSLLQYGISKRFHVFVVTSVVTGNVLTPEIRKLAQNTITFRQQSSVARLLGIKGAEYLRFPGEAIVQLNGMTYRCDTVFLEEDALDSLSAQLSRERQNAVSDLISDMESFSQTISLDGIGGVAGAAEDPLFTEIREYIIDVQKASTSLLQRRFGIGFNRAQRMIDLLEEKGVIGPAQGSMPREVYIKPADHVSEQREPGREDAFEQPAKQITEPSFVFEKEPIYRAAKKIAVRHDSVVKHYGIDTVVWIEDGKFMIESTDLGILPAEYVNEAKHTAENMYLPHSLTSIAFTMDLHKIVRVTLGRPKKHKGYIHVYFDQVNIDVGVKGSGQKKNITSKFDILVPFAKTQEQEFEEFARELVRRSGK